ncbi:type II toxin-antitoxin system PemK/MazF family toxin [Litoreibacter arenae]|uniref:type II toxin-antitoxin system PemK/MazF family toxin n=1 Tax=Litoreibacter arenae TaxID=491388 RepID=UPI0009F8AFAD
MAIEYHPPRGAIVCANFDQGFKVPEMVKRRLCVVISPPIEARFGLCTVVPLSRSDPEAVQPYHYQFEIPFQMPPNWGNGMRWAKCDMVCAVGFHRLDLLRLGKNAQGVRQYQLNTLSSIHLRHISNGVLASLGLPALTQP